MKTEIYKDVNREFRWRIKSANGKVVASSSESFHNQKDCRYNMELVAGALNAFLHPEA